MKKEDLGIIGIFTIAAVFFFGMIGLIINDIYKDVNRPGVIIQELRSGYGYFYFEDVKYPWDSAQVRKALREQKQVIANKVTKYNAHYNKFASVSDSIVLKVSQSTQAIADEKYRVQKDFGDNTLKLVPSAQMHYEILRLIEAYNQSAANCNIKITPPIPLLILTSDATDKQLVLY